MVVIMVVIYCLVVVVVVVLLVTFLTVMIVVEVFTAHLSPCIEWPLMHLVQAPFSYS